MPRKLRFNLPGLPQHVVQRGNNKSPCFYDTRDYLRYLDDLHQVATKYKCDIHAWVLMTNHVHLLLTPTMPFALPQTMQALGRRYVKYINTQYARSGTLWEGRYKSSLVQSQRYLLACYRYIEMNPVRADMVASPADYPWSSYHANAFGHPTALVTPHPEYLALAPNPLSRQHAYRELFSELLDESLLHEFRHNLNHELVVGNLRFKQQIQAQLKRSTMLGKKGPPKSKT